MAVVFLSFIAVFYWQYPSFRNEGLPLVLFFDVVFGYRFYRYVKMIQSKKSVEVNPL